MKPRHPTTRPTAFTLIELLVVISIIAVLAGMIMTAMTQVRVKQRIAETKIKINGIMGAIQAYEAEYSRLPVSPKVMDAVTADPANYPDFTFGTLDRYGNPLLGRNKSGQPKSAAGQSPCPVIRNGRRGSYEVDNSEIMAILRDVQTNRAGVATVNVGHARNPKQQVFLNEKEVNDLRSPGIGLDGVYRDPWGNPYLITLDLNGDNQCRDGFYRQRSVSQSQDPKNPNLGLNGLSCPPNTTLDNYEARVPMMVWSLGPDGWANPNQKANEGSNKDNILSWNWK